MLSTYNPNLHYLKEQIESLLSQDIVEYSYDIIIRDDGSTNVEVLSYLKILSEQRSNVIALFGENMGVFGSFWFLLDYAYKKGYDYVSLSDQDDIALPMKLSLAIKCLNKENKAIPILFFSQMIYVNDKLDKQGEPFVNTSVLGFSNALFESSVNGNLMVMNRKACELVVSKKPTSFYMHDWWIYICVAAFGKVIFSPTPTLLYRQHANNVIGGTDSFYDVMRRRIKRFSEYSDKTYPVYKQGMEVMELFGAQMDKEKRLVLNNLLNSKSSLLKRICYAFSSGNFIRMKTIDTLLLRFLILLNKY